MSAAAVSAVKAPASQPVDAAPVNKEEAVPAAKEAIKEAAEKTKGWLANKYEQAINFAAEHVYADVSKLKTDEKDGWVKTIGKVVTAVFALAVMLPIAAIVKLYKSVNSCACSKADKKDETSAEKSKVEDPAKEAPSSEVVAGKK